MSDSYILGGIFTDLQSNSHEDEATFICSTTTHISVEYTSRKLFASVQFKKFYKNNIDADRSKMDDRKHNMQRHAVWKTLSVKQMPIFVPMYWFIMSSDFQFEFRFDLWTENEASVWPVVSTERRFMSLEVRQEVVDNYMPPTVCPLWVISHQGKASNDTNYDSNIIHFYETKCIHFEDMHLIGNFTTTYFLLINFM